jgi:dTDP-4-amino-4,6-dideoxygalactose transaminase
MSIPFLDLRSMHDPLAGELRAALDGVLARSHYVLGPAVEAFEEAFAA